jgi:competence protein ComEC
MSGSERAAAGVRPQRPERRERADLRLLCVVGPMWLGQALVLLARPGPGAAAAGLAAGVGLIAVATLVGLRGTGGRRRPGASRTAVAGLVVAGAGLGLAVGSVHLSRLQAGPLARAAVGEEVVRATVQVTGDPRMHVPASDGGRQPAPTWSVPARLTAMAVRSRSTSARVPVLLRGAAVQHLRYGAVVALVGRAEPAWAAAEHALVLRVLGQPQERSPPGPIARITTAIRADFRAACAGLPADAGALLLGLAVGDESTLPVSLDEAMVRAGLAHLTAVSGSNTSLVAGLALGLVAALGLGWRSRILVAGLALAGYVALVRPQPSVLRAAAMGVVALVALGVGGRRRGAPALLAAVLVLLVVLPQMAVSLGFALSAAATAGLLLVGPGLVHRLGCWRTTRWLPEPLRAALAVAAAAHLATLPLALLMGNGASLVALPANVVVTPLVPVATVLGLAAALLAPIVPPVAAVLAHVAAPATALIAVVARTGAAMPGGVIPIPGGAGPALAAAGLLAAGALLAVRGWRPWRDRRVQVGLAVGLGLVVLARGARDARWPPPDWLVLACDVGQGDGLLIRSPGAAHALLVDAGPDPGAIGDCLSDAGVTSATVLLSHFHADHVDGLPGVVAAAQVGMILTTPVLEPPEGVGLVLTTARSAGIAVRAVRAGDRLQAAGLDLQVLWPAREIDESPANNGSVVSLVTVPGARPLRVLVTGDVEPEAQAAVMGRPSPVADVVKVPHHGSRYQHPGFAAWSGAGTALVSVGAGNDYGHPSATTLAQYAAAGVVGRSDEQGALAVSVDAGRPRLWVQR